MRKTKDEAYNLIEEMTLNNFQWSTYRTQPKQVGGKLGVDVITLLSAKVDVMTQRLNQMNINVVNSSTPSPDEICGSIEHITLNCQVGGPFFKDPNEVHYVQNFNLRPTNDPYSNTYNPGSKNHPNFCYKLNPNTANMPTMNVRAPPSFQRPPLLSQMPQMSNLEVMMENMLMV